jgi:signal peptidase I
VNIQAQATIGSARAVLNRRPWCWALAALTISVLLVASPIRFAVVVGTSMAPGLRTGDLLVVDTHAYTRAAPERGDTVVARYRKDVIVKRVVGLPGEEVEVHHGNVRINGTALLERYPIQLGWLNVGGGKLLPNKYALLGDNRAVSADEAVHAVLAKESIAGKVIGVIHWWRAPQATALAWARD